MGLPILQINEQITKHPLCARHHRGGPDPPLLPSRQKPMPQENEGVTGSARPSWRTTTFNPFDVRNEGWRAPRSLGLAQESFTSAIHLASSVFQGCWYSYPVPVQARFPLQELIRKAHCTPCAYPSPGPGSPWQSHRKRTVTLSMAGNLGVGAE